MYLGLLKTEFPERDARGIIICGEVNEGRMPNKPEYIIKDI